MTTTNRPRKFRGVFRNTWTHKGVKHTSRYWSISYWVRGQRVKESTRLTTAREAHEVLCQRKAAIAQGQIVPRRASKQTIGDLLDALEVEYRTNGRRSLRRLQGALAHLRSYLGAMRASEFKVSLINEYIQHRQEAGAMNSTINRELTALRRAYNLSIEREELPRAPRIKNLVEHNTREGFFTDEQIASVLRHLPEPLRPVVQFMSLTGWRVGEVLGLTWAQVDFPAGVVRLEPGTTKNREARTFPLYPELRALLDRQRAHTDQEQRRLKSIIPWVFHRQGSPIKSFRKAWVTATTRALCPGRIPHDLRRTAIRNMVRSGVSERVAMTLTGHRTRSVFERYNIVSQGDLLDAGTKLSHQPVSTVRVPSE